MAAGSRRPPTTRPPVGGSPPPRRQQPDRRGAAARRRFVTGCVAFFVVMLALAGLALLVRGDAPGTLAIVLPLAATYLASSAWLTALIVLLRSAQGTALTAWAAGGATLLVVFFVVQVVMARGA